MTNAHQPIPTQSSPDRSQTVAQAVALTVWFDGACPLCVREIALMRRLDRRQAIAFVDVAGDAACPIDRAELLARFHAQETGLPIVSGAAAFAAMWRAIPLLRPIGLLARNPLMLRMLEWLYLRFLAVRPRLQRLVTRLAPLRSGS
jgi:predicted DCC family thiol-disulfide oxidoreductase YuxK